MVAFLPECNPDNRLLKTKKKLIIILKIITDNYSIRSFDKTLKRKIKLEPISLLCVSDKHDKIVMALTFMCKHYYSSHSHGKRTNIC